MFILRSFKIREHQRGLLFRDGELRDVLRPGRHRFVDPLHKVHVDVLSVRAPWIEHPQADVLIKSGLLGTEAQVIDLEDHQRALVWLDGRFARLLGPGQHALWTVFHAVKVEVLDAREARFEHDKLPAILRKGELGGLLEVHNIQADRVGLFFRDGRFVATLQPGLHAFWTHVGPVRVVPVDMFESVIDVAGQEIMTADKVTLRLNAVVTYRVTAPLKAVSEVEDHVQALYREAQLALRAVIGERELDALLSGKDAVATDLLSIVGGRSARFGVEVLSLGIRDVILPGEMKDLLNQVTEARKAAEAALITRREETAAMRSQANTAKILDANPTLMRLRELEVLEQVAKNASLSVILGEKGLADRVTKLL